MYTHISVHMYIYVKESERQCTLSITCALSYTLSLVHNPVRRRRTKILLPPASTGTITP